MPFCIYVTFFHSGSVSIFAVYIHSDETKNSAYKNQAMKKCSKCFLHYLSEICRHMRGKDRIRKQKCNPRDGTLHIIWNGADWRWLAAMKCIPIQRIMQDLALNIENVPEEKNLEMKFLDLCSCCEHNRRKVSWLQRIKCRKSHDCLT